MAKKIPAAKASRPAKPAAVKKPKLAVSIDYPREKETVRPGHYAVRLSAGGAGQVQARLNEGEWLDCREAVGHHWLDWAPASGEVRIEARARAGKGRWSAVVARAVLVA